MMDVRFINPFIYAVKNVFNTMLGEEIMVSKPFIKAKNEANADVSAIIGLSGDAVGCVVLSFSMQTALNASGKFAGIEMTQDHEDFSDALGELANMVAGQAKAQMDGLNVSISLPSVVIGKEHQVSQSKNQPRLVLPCDSGLGRFCVEVAMVVEKKSEPQPQPASATVG
jgi:chemotaxis protein CheX